MLHMFISLGRFAKFENTVDRGLAENFGPDFGLVMSGSWHRAFGSLSSTIVRMLAAITRNETKLRNVGAVLPYMNYLGMSGGIVCGS